MLQFQPRGRSTKAKSEQIKARRSSSASVSGRIVRIFVEILRKSPISYFMEHFQICVACLSRQIWHSPVPNRVVICYLLNISVQSRAYSGVFGLFLRCLFNISTLLHFYSAQKCLQHLFVPTLIFTNRTQAFKCQSTRQCSLVGNISSLC